MIHDLITIIWKEWTETFAQAGKLKGGVATSVGVPVFVLGVFLPWQVGPKYFSEAIGPIMWTWMPVFMVATMVCESFAGERERHTLETLLASRLSDRTILFGKIAAAISYGWGIAIAGLLLSLATINLIHGRGRLIIIPASSAFAAIVVSLFGCAFAAAGGVLISLRAPTVRQAQQTLSVAMLVLMFGGIFGVKALPPHAQKWLLSFVTGSTLFKTALVAVVALAIADALLVSAAVARFQRARLILD